MKPACSPVTQEDNLLFVHRWTAAELARRWATQARDHELVTAHRQAAAYRQWRAQTWPQDPAADNRDLIEARYHHIAAGDLDQATNVTEQACSWLHRTGALDHESEPIHDTLRWLNPDSPDNQHSSTTSACSRRPGVIMWKLNTATLRRCKSWSG